MTGSIKDSVLPGYICTPGSENQHFYFGENKIEQLKFLLSTPQKKLNVSF